MREQEKERIFSLGRQYGKGSKKIGNGQLAKALGGITWGKRFFERFGTGWWDQHRRMLPGKQTWRSKRHRDNTEAKGDERDRVSKLVQDFKMSTGFGS